jgi:DNA-binding NarL/FixJ family response regulator
MQIVAITDIPRMTAFFERLVQQYPDLVVVNEIHRGIEELESRKPEVVLIQNHLSGLSADILQKHLKSRLGQHKARFGLISSSATLDVDTSVQFETILDPALDDTQLEQALERILQRQPAKKQEIAVPSQPAAPAQEPELPLEQQPPLSDAAGDTEADEEQPETPLTYEMPRRTGLSIISDFSKQLDTRSDTLQPEPVTARFSHRERELQIRDLHQEPHLIADFEEPQPWYRKTSFMLISVTLVVVVAVSLFQHRSNRTTTPAPKIASEQKTATATPPPAASAAAPQPEQKPALASHGTGRPRSLPSFIPKEGLEPGYGKDNPGWENYRGQTSEYRIFREKDGAIKAIQVIDRSGAGIQESFYTSILKELAGATVMRPTSSEIKEGYEIRRGELAGLQLVQYRDAQGGRMRGFVITWP